MPTAIIRFFASLILIVFCFYITPKEVLHLFTHHADTEHLVIHPSEQHFEKEHHHCILLKVDQHFSAPSFEIPFLDSFLENEFIINSSIVFNNNIISLFNCTSKQLRAPPVFV
jgi:hypothetical protein